MNTRTKNPHLVGALLDTLACRDRPASTSELSMALTSTMRRLVERGVVENDDVMTWNPLGYYEVTGATVASILAKQPEVVMTGISRRGGHGRREKHWATIHNAERWTRERSAREQALVEADTRYAILEDQARGHIRVLDTDRFGTGSSPVDAAIATFDINALPLDVARDLAQRAKRALVRKAVS